LLTENPNHKRCTSNGREKNNMRVPINTKRIKFHTHTHKKRRRREEDRSRMRRTAKPNKLKWNLKAGGGEKVINNYMDVCEKPNFCMLFY